MVAVSGLMTATPSSSSPAVFATDAYKRSPVGEAIRCVMPRINCFDEGSSGLITRVSAVTVLSCRGCLCRARHLARRHYGAGANAGDESGAAVIETIVPVHE